MADVLDDLGAYLASAVGALTLGSNLFLGVMPETPDTCVSLTETPGPAPEDTFGLGVATETPRIQAMTRAARYDDARTLARSVWSALASVPAGTVGGGTKGWLAVQVVQSPFLIGRDENDRAMLAFGIQAWREP